MMKEKLIDKSKSNDNNNIRTMEFIGEDDWSNTVYRCIETGVLYKDGASYDQCRQLNSIVENFFTQL